MTRNLHWSAVVGTAISLWLLIWLLLIGSSFYDIGQSGDDISSWQSTLIILGVLALWSAYRGVKRVVLLRNGELRTATVVKRTEETYDHEWGLRGKVSFNTYRYMVDQESYSNWFLFSFVLIRQRTVDIVYHSGNPSYSLPVKLLRARYDMASNQWRSSMWHAIPRLILFVAIVGSIVVLGLPLVLR